MQEIINRIKQYSQILIYRHVNPDMDAFGSQCGMYEWLITHFKEKNIVMMGDFTSDLTTQFFQQIPCQKVLEVDSLAIVLDTANKERIDGALDYVKEVIKIDHHLIVDQYGDINIVDEKASSCAQVVTLLWEQVANDYPLPQSAASALYKGIVGDSNRFLYRNTDQRTFHAAGLLVSQGIDIDALYQQMYLREEKDLEVTRFILNHYQKRKGIAYYILKQEDLTKLHLSREQGSNYVNTLANIKEFDIWMAITENVKDHNVRVSIRSRQVPVNEVANMFNGGGHALASGATLKDFDQLEDLLNELEKRLS